MVARFIDFIKTRPGIAVGTILVILMIAGLGTALQPRQAPRAMTTSYTNLVAPPPITLIRDSPKSVSIPPAIDAPQTPPPAVTNVAAPTSKPNKPVPPLHIHVELPPDTNPPPLGVYAPAGRLIRCQLVNTVDSGNADTPVIAIVTEDLWHDGKLVIPVGTEIHGRAQVDALRDRVIVTGTWTIVWQSGEELLVNGIALNREFNEQTGNWGITDGSAGLSGQVIKTNKWQEEVKLLAATMLSGMASGLEDSTTTVLGTQVASSAKNGALAGTSQVLNRYAQQELDKINKETAFVRVSGGKQMYLYVTQTIDRSQAKIGNLRVTTRPADSSNNPHNPKS
jgi:hypothetical protein